MTSNSWFWNCSMELKNEFLNWLTLFNFDILFDICYNLTPCGTCITQHRMLDHERNIEKHFIIYWIRNWTFNLRKVKIHMKAQIQLKFLEYSLIFITFFRLFWCFYVKLLNPRQRSYVLGPIRFSIKVLRRTVLRPTVLRRTVLCRTVLFRTVLRRTRWRPLGKHGFITKTDDKYNFTRVKIV